MKISNDILRAVREFNLEPNSGLLGMSEKVNKIFHKTEQFWHFILNIFTLGWFNADRKEQIKAALKGENNGAPVSPSEIAAAKERAAVAARVQRSCLALQLKPEDYRQCRRPAPSQLRFAG